MKLIYIFIIAVIIIYLILTIIERKIEILNILKTLKSKLVRKSKFKLLKEEVNLLKNRVDQIAERLDTSKKAVHVPAYWNEKNSDVNVLSDEEEESQKQIQTNICIDDNKYKSNIPELFKNYDRLCYDCKYIDSKAYINPCYTCLNDKSHPKFEPKKTREEILEENKKRKCNLCKYLYVQTNVEPCSKCYHYEYHPKFTPRDN